MTEWRLSPPGSAQAGRADQPRLFLASVTGWVLPWQALGAGTPCGVASGPVKVLTARRSGDGAWAVYTLGLVPGS
jgi:hypothetical protein